jgi:hypothetical protein
MNQWFNMREDKLKVDTENSAFSGINDFMSNLLTLVVVGGAIYYFAPIIFSRK